MAKQNFPKCTLAQKKFKGKGKKLYAVSVLDLSAGPDPEMDLWLADDEANLMAQVMKDAEIEQSQLDCREAEIWYIQVGTLE